MLIVHVHVRVRPEFVEGFKEAIIEDARSSVQEPSIARFDVVQRARRSHGLCVDRGVPQ